MSDDAHLAKAARRTAVLAARHQIPGDARRAAGAAIARLALAQWEHQSCVAAYLSVADEPPTEGLLEGLVAAGVRVLLPVIDTDGLDWAVFTGRHRVAPGPLGIAEPVGERLGATAVGAAAVVVIPALSIDRRGNRLGRGRGYYDRALIGVTAMVAAVVYDEEFVDELPVEAHDRRVDAVLRPAGFTVLG